MSSSPSEILKKWFDSEGTIFPGTPDSTEPTFLISENDFLKLIQHEDYSDLESFILINDNEVCIVALVLDAYHSDLLNDLFKEADSKRAIGISLKKRIVSNPKAYYLAKEREFEKDI